MPNVTIVVDVLNGFCKEGNLASPRCYAAIPKILTAVEERRRTSDNPPLLADTHHPHKHAFSVFPMP